MMGRVKIWGRQFEGIDWMAAWLADVCLRDLSRGEYFIVTASTGNSTRGGGEKSISCDGLMVARHSRILSDRYFGGGEVALGSCCCCWAVWREFE